MPAFALQAKTYQLNDLMNYAKNNQPAIKSLNTQIENLQNELDQLETLYDPSYESSYVYSTGKQRSTYLAEPEAYEFYSAKLSAKKGFENGLKVELYGDFRREDFLYINADPLSNNSTVAGNFGPGSRFHFYTGINASYPLFENGGGILEKMYLEMKQNEIKLKRLQINQKIQDEKWKIYQAYFQLQLMQEIQKSQSKIYERQKEYLDMATEKKEKGFTDELEWKIVRLSFMKAEVELNTASQKLDEALFDLKTKLAYPVDQDLEISFDGAPAQEKDLDYAQVEKNVLNNDLNSQSLSMNILLNLQNVMQSENKLLPQVDLVGSFFTAGSGLDAFETLKENLSVFQYPNFFLGVKSDLGFTPRSEKIQNEIAKNGLAVAKQDKENYAIELKNMIQKSYQQYQTSSLNLKKYGEIKTEYENYLYLIKAKYLKGVIDRNKIIEAETESQKIQMAYLQTLFQNNLSHSLLLYLQGAL
jgi:outer membrane protein TolC